MDDFVSSQYTLLSHQSHYALTSISNIQHSRENRPPLSDANQYKRLTRAALENWESYT